MNSSTDIDRASVNRISTDRYSNTFVGYLNSLQRSSGGNENALAESQACNPLFAHIHVSHPLTTTILTELNSASGKHVILTGHAGDGKSTIALEVFKYLSEIPADQPLMTKPPAAIPIRLKSHC